MSAAVIPAAVEPPPGRAGRFAAADLVLALIAALLMGVTHFPIVQGLLSGPSDYTHHVEFAQLFLDKGILFSPACLLHLLAAALVRLGLAASCQGAILMVAVSAYAALGAALYLYARVILETASRLAPTLIASVVPFVQPAVPWGSTYVIGYIWAEPYFSPSYALLKPLALAAAAFAMYFLTASGKTHWPVISLCAASVAAGTLAKPSFTICALPAVVLLSAHNWFRKTPFSKTGVAFAWLLPAAAVLAWQIQRTYASPGGLGHYTDTVVFAPLAVMRIHAAGLSAKYFLSILFPLSVVLAYGRRAWADAGLRFSLVVFAFGTIYAYGLGERHQLASGNFLWCAYITLFILHFFAVVFLVKQITAAVPEARTPMRALPCLALLAWQLSIGISVYRTVLTGILANVGSR